MAQTTEPVAEALATARGGRVIVIDEVRLARALRERGFDVVAVASRLRPLARSAGARVCSSPSALPLADGCAGAVVALGIGGAEPWRPAIEALSRIVREGGVVVLVDRAEPTELSRRVLCGGLAGIEQRTAGRSCVTSGVVRRWA